MPASNKVLAVDQGRLTIAVMLGGPSAERSISLKSGAAIIAALRSRGHRVSACDPNADLGDSNVAATPETCATAARFVRGHNWSDVDVVFNALHGAFGEDGELQRLLCSLGVAFTGSGETASHEGFHKVISKRRFRAAGVPTPVGFEIAHNRLPNPIATAAEAIGYPLVVKPEAQGSSLGVTIATSPLELSRAIEFGFVYGPVLLVEEYIAGTEWTVPIWDDEVLPMIEIAAADQFYDYTAKYSDNRTEYRFDSPLPPLVRQRLIAAARRAARAVGMEGLSRVDLRLTSDGRPYVLEVNNSPGMTDHSLVPKSAARMGLTLGELCEQECRRAIHRQRGRRRRSA
ncbi:MAG: D-alanine--D-alanine ligase [Planctomycetaceae bacterium]